MAKTVCKVLGVVFLLVGVAGFVNQGLLGAHLTRHTMSFTSYLGRSHFISALPDRWQLPKASHSYLELPFSRWEF